MVEIPIRSSWKGPETALWKGMTRLTPASHGEGRLRMIKNGYLSPDGTEIRQFPGSKCVVNLAGTGYPDTVAFPETDTGFTREVIDFQDDFVSPPVIINSFTRPVSLHAFEVCRGRLVIIGESDFKKWYVTDTSDNGIVFTTATQNGASTELTFTASVSTNVVIVGSLLYIENSGVAALDDKNHTITVVAGAVVTISTATVGQTSGLSGHAYIERWPDSPLPVEPDALTIYTVDRLPDHATPSVTCWPATVANRLRDWGTTRDPGSYAQPQSMASFPAEGWSGSVPHGLSRRKQLKLPYRLVPEVTADRILMAARGYGVVFQAPVKIPPSNDPALGITTLRNNHIYDKPRGLGIPKAMMLAPADMTGMLPSTDGNYTAAQTLGTYRIKVVYRDSGTFDSGLASEELIIPVGSAAMRIRLYVMHPGYLMGECMADIIDIYASAPGGDTLGFLTSVSIPVNGVVGASSNFADLLYEVNLFGFTESQIDFDRTPATDVQMPMGCNALRTIRGVTIFGGTVGSVGRTLHLQGGDITYYPGQGANWSDNNEIMIQLLGDNADILQDEFNVGSAMIPPAYVGLSLFCDTAFPEAVKSVLLDLLKNTDAVYSAGAYATPNKWFPRIAVVDQPSVLGVSTTFSSSPQDAVLSLPRGLLWWGETGEPARVPAINQIYLDADADDDIEAIGRYGNFAIIMTRRQTFRLQWGQVLRQENPPQVLDPREGCISANSVVEADDFLGWMSDRGPYGIVGGGTEWIGKPLKPYFEDAGARYKRDSLGLMLHSWSTYDPERGLIYFGVRVADGGFDAETDGEKSKYPCDEVLIYSLDHDAWSIWVPPTGVLWMRRLLCLDGVNRMCFLADDNRIYALDDNWADGNTNPITATASADTTSATFTANAGAFNTTANPFTAGTYARVGMHYVLYKGINWPATEQGKIIGKGQISTLGTTTTIVLDQSLTWKASDILLVGVLPPMEIETNSEAFGGDRPKKVKAVNARYSFFKDHKAWVEITSDSSKATTPVNLQRGKDETYNRMEFVTSHDAEKVTQSRYSRGATRGDENNFTLKVYGGPQVRIQDIVTEVADA